ncbi:MAG: GTPase HflX [Alphaproteobacteria bacterium]|nr:GTPase HflX [Alphaproteobacteria bacterium]
MNEAALVVHPVVRKDALRAPEARLAEAVRLTESIGVAVPATRIVRLARPRPATLLGNGAIDDVGEALAEEGAGLVVVDGALTPVQQRNLERAWDAKVIDRTGLILEIFGARARTREGVLQVDLAALSYQRTRLVRSWTHLERQRGGAGFLGGPGEAQIEIDRRLIDEKIVKLKRQLESVRRTRGIQRRARRRVPFPVVALVGYTNAGKSTLFNRLTGGKVLARDQLFATLDPTMRGIDLPSGRRAILSDTVGFISDLPTQLVAAFRATLEEVVEADLILHVRDIADPDTAAQKHDVDLVMDELDAHRTPRIELWNKIDLLDAPPPANGSGIPVSAATGQGVENLLRAVDAELARSQRVCEFVLSPGDGAAIAWLYRHGEVQHREDGDDRVSLTVALDPADRARFERRFQPERSSRTPASRSKR